ncbi:hypothetical protein [Mesorhizobium sp. 1M-11]|uniref:hypothetical protein n=1 Tax=Mesorhizobium sp. 1M-11 TaxID=1529006 RepID=UPI0006C76255|nr:hypothetical protein [Mesorhizobium sp. 1M-11]
MNNLSWLIYAAEVSERIQEACVFITFVIGIIGGAALLVAFIGTLAEGGKLRYPVVAFLFWLPITILSLGGAWLLPSSKTIYMIAASEAGAQVVTSPDAVEMMGDLKAIIKKRLKAELEGK